MAQREADSVGCRFEVHLMGTPAICPWQAA